MRTVKLNEWFSKCVRDSKQWKERGGVIRWDISCYCCGEIIKEHAEDWGWCADKKYWETLCGKCLMKDDLALKEWCDSFGVKQVKTCKTCKWWTNSGGNWRACGKIESSLAIATKHNNEPEFLTCSDFGCIHWEAEQ